MFFCRQKMLNPTLDLEEIRSILCAIALAHPDVCFTLRNEVTGRNLLQTKLQSRDGAALVFAELYGKDWADKLVPVGSVREPCDKIKTRITISGIRTHSF
jgi:DNA mismatch repair ATPase MutL